MGSVIGGTGISVPDNVVSNHDLARIMDTTDEWITTRTGVKERRFVEPGVGSSDLATDAVLAALDDAGLAPESVDALITATMTPDYLAPGIAGLVQRGAGLSHVAAYDLRQQCSGFLYGLDLADALIASDRAGTVVVVGSEVHAGFQPWSAESWQSVLGEVGSVSDEDFERNTRYRAWSVLFGDGAGAMVLQRGSVEEEGILATSLHTDGESFELIWVPGIGSKSRPYVSPPALADDRHLPRMDGAGLYRSAVRLMPEAARAVLEKAGLELDDVDIVVAHQANDRILEGVRKQFGMSPEKVPSNIGAYGNTTAGTLPILYHELRGSGRVGPGTLVCFAAFGAGAHYGAVLYRHPRELT
ncbi:MAG TPA: 3-oxoacyl-[acyl-carrier-protein] synthase III C-terminal domain-containing protein [Acidimicrobiia bacterium]|nr:3-oxoacyl-[acyl-carrier-protein] synthase III C-terminal domain-containing protein [Acidimicrobiia bacterium]